MTSEVNGMARRVCITFLPYLATHHCFQKKDGFDIIAPSILLHVRGLNMTSQAINNSYQSSAMRKTKANNPWLKAFEPKQDGTSFGHNFETPLRQSDTPERIVFVLDANLKDICEEEVCMVIAKKAVVLCNDFRHQHIKNFPLLFSRHSHRSSL